MKWISFLDEKPISGQSIAAIRICYPASYWVGNWNAGMNNLEEPLEFWYPIPPLPADYLWVNEKEEVSNE